MLGALIVVFREVLEAALIVGIVLAATKGVTKRSLWVGYGISLGIVGAVVVAVFADVIASAASGMGQEVFNASVLFLAVIMLGWHNVWMSRHGRQMMSQMKQIGGAVVAGHRPLYALSIVVCLAVLREGAETVLFLYGIIIASDSQYVPVISGGILGLAAGCAIGITLYFGLLRIPVKHLFTVIGWMVLLLAAGMASQGAGFLVQADVLPSLGGTIWDTSSVLSEHSLLGQILHVLVGYISQPAGIQLIFYVITIITIGLLMLRYGKSGSSFTTANVKK